MINPPRHRSVSMILTLEGLFSCLPGTVIGILSMPPSHAQKRAGARNTEIETFQGFILMKCDSIEYSETCTSALKRVFSCETITKVPDTRCWFATELTEGTQIKKNAKPLMLQVLPLWVTLKIKSGWLARRQRKRLRAWPRKAWDERGKCARYPRQIRQTL